MDALFASPPKHPGKYDVIMALSGGVDSSYALYRLKKEYPHVKVLAVQFDNGFISDTAFYNAKKFCDLTKSTYFRLVLDNKRCGTRLKKQPAQRMPIRVLQNTGQVTCATPA